MYLLFFLLWIIFNGSITPEIIILGLIISGIMYAFICKFMDYSLKKDILLFRLLPLFLRYAAVLIWEIGKANLVTIRLIISSKYIIEPEIIHFRTNLKSRLTRVILANSITLTPGTITVSLEQDELVIHCLDKDMGKGIEDSIFVELLQQIEEKGAEYGHAKQS
ncbi:MAG: Na+/H+ antiporter subunit E [Lachnospiraceae bacterium]|nr:Na+/H+ antiporter subunit E [Lachnospiraceae bacterium]MCI7596900.1 Na+/H+ antiporter subunit E [Lachnospiraceae bacterium]MDD7050099.1 Na+/H+ antiporter subunit E [Lachnospiraceae bacterium]MDY3221635.1 Na+/H+ antiporter subunit E [Lachnospiraceae bacterium]MDY4097555.1 Na+/H+ antiporter subunit E [Lachnospiraceae bacterium]